MPKFHPEAPDLVVSPDGKWAAELTVSELLVYSLTASDPEQTSLQPVETLRHDDRPGRIFFVHPERLLHLWVEEGTDTSTGCVVAELLSVPQLSKIGRSVRVPGAVRILGGGPGGVVVAPSGAGAELVIPRESDIIVYKLFVRGEALSAGATPDRRVVIEQRGVFEIWDTQTRRAMAKLILNTRQAPLQLGFVGDGKMVWALTSAIPMRIEVFRASDGLRLLELEQPGRGLCAETAPGRLVIGFEDHQHISFLDLDVTTRSLRRVSVPEGSPQPLCFAISASSKQPELLVRRDDPEQPFVRLPLAKITTKETVSQPGTETRGSSRLSQPAPRPVSKTDAAAKLSARALRDARPESRLIRRLLEAESAQAESRSRPPAPLGPDQSPSRRSPRPDPVEADSPKDSEPDEADSLDKSAAEPEASAAREDSEPVAVPLVPEIALGGQPSPPQVPSPPPRPALRAYDAQRSPAAWQWELARWAQGCLQTAESAPPPSAGPLHELGTRLSLSIAAQRVLGLLYAASWLLGHRARGMRPVELAVSLRGQCEEPDVLCELLPSAPLHTLDLIAQRPDGRLMIRPAVAQRLSGAPDPQVQWPQTPSKEVLVPGLYLLDGPCVTRPARLLGRAVLRLDGLTEPQPHKALPGLLRRALLHDAVLVIDGLCGLSYPAFGAPTVLSELLPQLAAPRVPIVLWAMPDAAAATGLGGRKLSELIIVRDGPAPGYPSSALPPGVLFRPPAPAAKAAASVRASGQLIVHQSADRRAALVLGPSANAEAYARAAYLAARDGALLVLEAELTPPRTALLALLLRQLPVVVSATPPGGTDQPWPMELRPFAHA
ncbi:MAG: hypothetical protein JNM40_22170 [Myxococcales bacterium]|nr:hypothetical protein [Myxococcales bacterium]